ncbi:MAG: response regulator transcription factor [Lachnospiraceae bacterium]|nr:response regulator transcription factor [Lachnospiraceae bacterium]
MYKILIADDEEYIRNGLRCIMDWEAEGFTVCGDAANGEAALSMIRQLRPDLVLIDIRMPKINGLEVVKRCSEQELPCKFIIISGFSDFTYAQTAIRYGVENYLTKPLDEDELLQAVRRTKISLDDQYRNMNHLEHIRRKAKDAILHDIVLGAEDLPALLEGNDIEPLELAADVYQIVIYESFSQDKDSPFYSFADLLQVSNHGQHTFNDFEEDHKNVILLKGNYALSRFRDFLKHYQGSNPPQKGSPLDTLFLAYGRPVTTLEEVHLSYQDALTLIRRRFFCIQGQHTLGYDELPDLSSHTNRITPEYLQQNAELLTGYLQTFNRNNVAKTLFRLEEYLYNVSNEISEVKLFLTDLYLQIKEKMSVLYPNSAIPFSGNSAVINIIEQKAYLYEIIQFLSEQFEMIMNATGNPSRDNIMDDILYYIEHNYHNNIKLETIAPLFGYNSAYLGKIFSKTVGENFNSYIDHMRIEHSKKLLLNNTYKVYEIAEKVGYRNVDYFHKKFRKYVGESPAEYRKKYGQGEE